MSAAASSSSIVVERQQMSVDIAGVGSGLRWADSSTRSHDSFSMMMAHHDSKARYRLDFLCK